jgi:UDP:flavonoid glycosyltransferase YjiC (YdhE family)
MAAKLKRLSPRRLWKDCDAVLVCTDRELDPAGSRDWPGTFAWTGPVQPETAAARPVSPPRVLVSLSTTAFPGQREALQNILDGLADAPVEVVLTTGPPVDPSELTVPANAAVHAFLHHDEVMAGCSAVIGHGGHSTTIRALAHGLPLVIMPMHPMLDQPMVGKAVEEAGAGVSIRRTSSPTEIRAALDTVLDGPHHVAAAEIGARWRGTDGAVEAADRILALRTEPVSQ